jgi:nucleotide-binding universal stress UspA family protein
MCPVNLEHGAGQEKALRYAAALAHTFGAKLYVCYSIETAEPSSAQVIEAAEEELQKLVERLMSAFFPQAEDAAPDWESFVLRGNDPSEAITREAAKLRIDLICMGSRRRPLRAALIGSTAERVARSAPCPVLVTHPDGREWLNGKPGAMTLKRVLVAHDFSDYAEMALNYARLLAQKNKAELHLLHVLPAPLMNEPELAWTQGVAEGAYHKAARQLQHFVPGEAKKWRSVKTAVRWGKPYREVLAYAREHEIDLICMGAHGAGFELQALFGSNVDRVLRQSPCPMLIARPLKPSLAAVDLQD